MFLVAYELEDFHKEHIWTKADLLRLMNCTEPWVRGDFIIFLEKKLSYSRFLCFFIFILLCNSVLIVHKFAQHTRFGVHM